MDLDLRMMLTLGGMLVSVVSAAAIARQQIKQLTEQIKDIETRLRQLDNRLDKNDNNTDSMLQRMGILADMMSPDTMERRHREVEALKKDVEYLKKAAS